MEEIKFLLQFLEGSQTIDYILNPPPRNRRSLPKMFLKNVLEGSILIY